MIDAIKQQEVFGVRISDATEGDIPGMQEVYQKTWVQTYPNEEYDITREDVEARVSGLMDPERIEKRRQDLATAGKEKKILVARQGKKVIGVCRLSKGHPENRLQTLYVLPDRQGEGIGTMLWQEAQKFFDPEQDTLVNVVEYNKKAKNFYKKLGFQETGERLEQERFPSGKVMPEIQMRLKARAQGEEMGLAA